MEEKRKDRFIPLHRPYFTPEEEEAVLSVLKSTRIGGNGPITKKVEEMLAKLTSSPYALLTTSCTHALEMGVMCFNISPGDEVILPSFAYVSAANAIVREGGKPVFAEIDPDTLNLDPKDAEQRITKKTRGFILIHYAGIPCDMDAFKKLAEKYGLFIIEDAAQGIGARYKGKHLGAIGDVGCISFHETKNITCGEGGAFLTGREDLFHKAEIIREKGTNRSAFLRGEIDKYSWAGVGSSFIPSELLAALLEVQLKRLEMVNERRGRIYHFYRERLSELEKKGKIRLPKIPDYATPNYHIFYFLMENEELTDKVLGRLRSRGIGATFHFVPLHSSPYGREVLGYREEDFPLTNRVSRSLIRLPLFPELTEEEINYIVEEVKRAILEV
ncbi:MAG: dTDP-4-amino-4,6-dideoxygalactose transaminase [Acidobacteria bacterium]|nr:dTDP-4-amino-4,6-dideoxygalactose transaminase [Acidobacteriota bacterium]